MEKQIEDVKGLLGKYVKKPPLAEKHLARPPFKFLRDIFLTVMNETGFYHGLFSPAELDSTGLNTKEEKSEFLSKIIKVTELATGTTVEARVNKILAGQDPEKTLDFLMLLANTLEKGTSSKEAVATVLHGGGPPEKKKSNPEVVSRPKEKTSTDSIPGKSKSVKDAGKGKDVAKKTTSQPVVVKSGGAAAASSTNQKPAPRQTEKEKASNVKTSTNSKVKPPASKGTKPTTTDGKVAEKSGTTARGEDKRERSRSRDDGKGDQKTTAPQQPVRRDSKSREKSLPRAEVAKNEPPPTIAKIPSKEDLKTPSGSQSTSKERLIPKNDEVTKGKEAEVAEDSIPVVKNEEDSLQFMGEVESLLQEHGIQIEANQSSSNSEKRKRSSVERKPSAGVKTVAEKPLSQNQGQEKVAILDEVEEESSAAAAHNILIPDLSPPQFPMLTKPSAVTKSDDSDVDTDESEIGPLGNPKQNAAGGIRKLPDSGTSEGDSSGSGRAKPPPPVARPPSSFARPTSARPAPPRPKTAVVEEEVAYRPPTTKIPVIFDSKDEDEEDEAVASADTRKQELLDLLTSTATLGTRGSEGVDLNDLEGRGHLVQQIVETKRELEGGDKSKEEEDMRNLRKQTQGELEALKGLIQSSARLANPLARILDFLQEDIDAMTAEYVKYNTEWKKLNEVLEKEKEITRQRLKPKRLELLDLKDKLEQQNFEIRAAHNDLHAVEEHLHNYMATIDSAPDRVDIPTRFVISGEWEFDLDVAAEEHDALEKRAKPRRGVFGEFPPFLAVSAEARENDKLGGKGFNIPKPKRKTQQIQPIPSFMMKKEFKKPTFAIEPDEEDFGMGFQSRGKQQQQRFGERRRSSQFLEPPEPELDSLEILGEK